VGQLAFDPPNKASAHTALLRAAEISGHSVTALRDLLWLVNAHPELIGHAQIFRNLHIFLTSMVFERNSVTWSKDWNQNIDQWIEICRWTWDARVTLSRLPGLSEFNLRKNDSHPLLGRGISRHPIPAALWNEWETASRSKRHDKEQIEINPYQLLQAHLFAASADARFRLSSREEYESHSAEHEFPVAPLRAAPVSIATREYSLATYAAVVTSLPQVANTVEFSNALQSHTLPLEGLSDADQYWAQEYFDRLKRFFKRFLDVREGYRPPQTLRTGWHSGGGGGGKRHPGYIDLAEETGLVFVQATPPEKDPDPDIPQKMIGKTICATPLPQPQRNKSSAKKGIFTAGDLEASGLSPNELLDEIVTLVAPDELRKNLQTLRNQRALLEMQAQHFPFDVANLTQTELAHIWKNANQAIQAYRDDPEQSDEQRIAAIAGILIKLSIAYGQSIEKLASCVWIYGESSVHPPIGIAAQRLPAMLFIQTNDHYGWQFSGVIQPPLSPEYLTRLPEALEAIDPCILSPFVLPDHLEIAKDFFAIQEQQPRNEAPAFGTQYNEIWRAVNAIIDNCNAELYFSKSYDELLDKHNDDQLPNKKIKQQKRITPQKIAQTLRSTLIFTTGDETLSDITTHNQAAANEPRLFYSRHSESRTLSTYRRAARYIGKSVGIRIPAKQLPPAPLEKERRFTGGARFVISKDELVNLVHALKLELLDKNVDHDSFDDVAGYHNNYVLYGLLYQSLSSTLRAIRNLGDIYKTWQSQRENPRILCGIKDKGSSHDEKVRLILIHEGLAKQFSFLEQHDQYLVRHPNFNISLTRPDIRSSAPFYFLSEDHLVVPATPSKIGEVLEDFGDFPIPPNFHRSFIRTDLTGSDCPTEVIDAFLGHANLGQSAFQKYSTFDYTLFIEIIETHIRRLHEELCLIPIESRAIPFSVRRPNQ